MGKHTVAAGLHTTVVRDGPKGRKHIDVPRKRWAFSSLQIKKKRGRGGRLR